jgi:hypothetical protein
MGDLDKNIFRTPNPFIGGDVSKAKSDEERPLALTGHF